jgi:hypothetical protein
MVKRQPSPHKRLTPDTSHTACVFRTPWGWMGVSETTKGIDAIVLPKESRQAVLSELHTGSIELQDDQASPRLREAQAQLIDYLAGTRRSFDLPYGRAFNVNRRAGHPLNHSLHSDDRPRRSSSRVPSRASSFRFVGKPHENPPSDISCATIRWQGITIGIGFAPTALPTARAYCLPPTRAATH